MTTKSKLVKGARIRVGNDNATILKRRYITHPLAGRQKDFYLEVKYDDGRHDWADLKHVTLIDEPHNTKADQTEFTATLVSIDGDQEEFSDFLGRTGTLTIGPVPKFKLPDGGDFFVMHRKRVLRTKTRTTIVTVLGNTFRFTNKEAK
jgi:hypothetical protein